VSSGPEQRALGGDRPRNRRLGPFLWLETPIDVIFVSECVDDDEPSFQYGLLLNQLGDAVAAGPSQSIVAYRRIMSWSTPCQGADCTQRYSAVLQ
jgi:hypothetical protein